MIGGVIAADEARLLWPVDAFLAARNIVDLSWRRSLGFAETTAVHPSTA